MNRKNPHSGLQKFLLVVFGILFTLAAVYCVYRVADAALNHVLPGQSIFFTGKPGY